VAIDMILGGLLSALPPKGPSPLNTMYRNSRSF